MSNTGCQVKPEAVREIVFGTVTTSYQQLGPAFTGFQRYLTMDNGFDVDMYLSLDGVTDMWRVRPGQAKIFDLKTNDILINPGDTISIRTKSAASSGDAFVECAKS